MIGFRNAVVSSAHPLASSLAVSVLKKGGNAIDAAVAVSLMLGVAEPAFSGLGGGGFALVHLASGESVAIDYRETAPFASSSSMFEVLPDGEVRDNLNSIGPLAIATPGALAGLCHLLDAYGTMKFNDISEKVIALAKSGIPIGRLVVKILRENRYFALDKLRKYEASSRAFLKDGEIPRAQEKLRVPDLARMLREISTERRDSFYTGGIAKLIVNHVQNIGGIIASEDLARYAVKLRKPVAGTYRGFTIVSMPPPSAGGALLLQALNILENFDYEAYRSNWLHLIADSIRLALTDKATHFADPDFVEIPLLSLVGKQYARKRSSRIQEKLTLRLKQRANAESVGSTTHFSIIDAERNIVAISESIECYFGSGVTIPGLGLLMNDEMHDFTPLPGKPNSIEPGKRPVSSMTPTIIFKDNEPFLTLGGAGSERIISSIVQVVSNVIDRKMPIADALAQPRIHPVAGALFAEGHLQRRTMKMLRTKGHTVVVKPAMDLYFGGIQAIHVDTKKKIFDGASDPRRSGKALGY